MLYISFVWTCAAFTAGVKNRTRRNWNDNYAQRFIKAYYNQGVIGALDKNFRFGGKQVGSLKLTEAPFQQLTGKMSESDYQAEGLAWMEQQGIKIRGLHPREFFLNWQQANEMVWVVTFTKLENM